MATRTFADLSSYRRAVDESKRTSDLLNSVIGGLQQGVQLGQLPQTLQDQALARQLNNAVTQQKLIDLQNPEAALARQIERELTIKGALNPNLGLVNLERGLGTIATPAAITTTQQAALPSVLTPSTVLPTAPLGSPVTEVTPFGIGTGVYSDPSIPLAAAQRASEADLNKIIAEATIKNQLDSQRVQSFSPGSMVGTAEQVRRGEGVRIPDRTAEPKPFSLSPGEKLFAPDGSVLAENPSNSTSVRPITVSPGSVVIGADGEEIFRNPVSTTGTASKPLPKTISERISDAQSAIDNLVTLKSYIESPSVKSISGPVAGRTLGNNPFSTTAQNFEGVRSTAKQVIGKYLEGGVLREADERKYEKIIPGLKMLGPTQDNQIVELYQTLRNKLLRDLDSYQKSGYDVSQLSNAVSALDVEFNKGKVSDSNLNSDSRALKIKEDLTAGRITRDQAKKLIQDLK